MYSPEGAPPLGWHQGVCAGAGAAEGGAEPGVAPHQGRGGGRRAGGQGHGTGGHTRHSSLGRSFMVSTFICQA